MQVRRSWVVGAAGPLLGLGAFALLPSPHGAAVATGLAAGGLLAAAVLGADGVSPPTSRRLAAGPARAARDLVDAMALAHPPILVPAGENLSQEVLFLPSGDASLPLPTLDAHTRLYVAPPGLRSGVVVEPPGLATVLHAERATGASLPDATLADVEAFLAGLGAREDLWRGVGVTREGETGYLVALACGPAAPCLDDETPCASGFCPACSAATVALARALRRPLRLAAARREGAAMRLHLEETR